MNTTTPELFFSNLPEIEALPFDLCVSIFEDDKAANHFSPRGVPPHIAKVITAAMDKTSGMFGVSLQVWKEDRRCAG